MSNVPLSETLIVGQPEESLVAQGIRSYYEFCPCARTGQVPLQMLPHQEPKKDTNSDCHPTRSSKSTDISLNIHHYADNSITNCFTCMEYQWSLFPVCCDCQWKDFSSWMSFLWTWVWISQPYEQLICLLLFLLILNDYFSICFYFGWLWRNCCEGSAFLIFMIADNWFYLI
jgi:hypothetical protein